MVGASIFPVWFEASSNSINFRNRSQIPDWFTTGITIQIKMTTSNNGYFDVSGQNTDIQYTLTRLPTNTNPNIVDEGTDGSGLMFYPTLILISESNGVDRSPQRFSIIQH